MVRCTAVLYDAVRCGAVCRGASCCAVSGCAVVLDGPFSLPFWRRMGQGLVRLARSVAWDPGRGHVACWWLLYTPPHGQYSPSCGTGTEGTPAGTAEERARDLQAWSADQDSSLCRPRGGYPEATAAEGFSLAATL